MKGRSTQRNEGFHRFLKPGALAQLRDSKVTARSRRHSLLIQKSLSILSLVPNATPIDSFFPSEASNSPNQFNVVPTFTLKINRPRCLQRKKLFAVTPVFTEDERL